MTKLKNDRVAILNRPGKNYYSGNLDIGQCWTVLLLFRESNGFEKHMCLRLIPDHPLLCNMLEMTIGTLHGFDEKSIY